MERYVGIGETSKVLGESISTLQVLGGERQARARAYAGRAPALQRREAAPGTVPGLRDAAQRRSAGPMPGCRAMIKRPTWSVRSRFWNCTAPARARTFEVISDLGSGMNYRKKGLKRLVAAILDGSVDQLVVTLKDQLLRFGSELVFAICEAKGGEVVILNRGEDTSFEEDLAKDVLEIVAVFSAGSTAAGRTGTGNCSTAWRGRWRNRRRADCATHRTRSHGCAAQLFPAAHRAWPASPGTGRWRSRAGSMRPGRPTRPCCRRRIQRCAWTSTGASDPSSRGCTT